MNFSFRLNRKLFRRKLIPLVTICVWLQIYLEQKPFFSLCLPKGTHTYSLSFFSPSPTPLKVEPVNPELRTLPPLKEICSEDKIISVLCALSCRLNKTLEEIRGLMCCDSSCMIYIPSPPPPRRDQGNTLKEQYGGGRGNESKSEDPEESRAHMWKIQASRRKTFLFVK